MNKPLLASALCCLALSAVASQMDIRIAVMFSLCSLILVLMLAVKK